MQSLEYNHEDFDPKAQKAQNSGNLVKFFMRRKPTTGELVEYIDIKIAGNRSGGACRPARMDDVQNYPEHYAAFKNRTTPPSDGTPLIEWPMVNENQVNQLSFINVKTVEHLATLSDTHVDNMMGLVSLKKKAKEWLEYEAERKQSSELKSELAARDERIAELEANINALAKPKRKYVRKKVVEDGDK